MLKDPPPFDLSSPGGRTRAWLDFIFRDYAYLRVIHPNAHWIGPDLVRTAQPWPFQLAAWKRKGVRTVINLRGEPHKSHHVIETDAVARLGLVMADFQIFSREPPKPEVVLGARQLFETIEYPALMHCKSGADRAGLMAVLYRHFHVGESIAVARRELAMRFGHFRQGYTGVLDHFLDRYQTEGEARGISLTDWVSSPAYDPAAMQAEFRATWWGTMLTEKLLRRE